MPNYEHRQRDELEFQIALGQAFQAVIGPASPKAGDLCPHTNALRTVEQIGATRASPIWDLDPSPDAGRTRSVAARSRWPGEGKDRRPQRGQDFIVERKIEDGVSLRAQLAMPPHGMERRIRPRPVGIDMGAAAGHLADTPGRLHDRALGRSNYRFFFFFA
jgi:hypothetical protein